MATSAFSTLLRSLLGGGGLLFYTTVAWAQAAPHGYDFPTVTVLESPYKKEAYLSFSSAFQEQTTIALLSTDVYATSPEEHLRSIENTTVINKQLGALTANGWELTQMNTSISYGSRIITRYLFRKPRP